MIILTRQNGSLFAINNDLIETIEEHPDTTLKMVDGKVYIVAESIDEIINKIILFRRECIKNVFFGIEKKSDGSENIN
ncbi:MAG: flagellar FlbD family protein [Ruminococcus sp.]|jgi:flagellar protein FlbD|nr:flagellar FlbD family protein [Ruminococcus sp.]